MKGRYDFRLPDPKSVKIQQILKELSAKKWLIIPKQAPRWASGGFCDENVGRRVAEHGGSACWGWDLGEHVVCLQTGRGLTYGLMMAVRHTFITDPGVISTGDR